MGGENHEELEQLSGCITIVEELAGDGSPLVQDGGVSRNVSIDHLVQLLGAHGRKELQRSANRGLVDGEAHQAVGVGVML